MKKIIIVFLFICTSCLYANDFEYQKIELGTKYSNYQWITSSIKGQVGLNVSLFNQENYLGISAKYKSFFGSLGSRINMPFQYTPFFNGLYLEGAIVGGYDGYVKTKIVASDAFSYVQSGTESIGVLLSKKDTLERIGGYVSYRLDNENSSGLLTDQYQINLNVAFQDIRQKEEKLGQTLYVFTEALQDEGELPIKVTAGYLTNEVSEYTATKTDDSVTNYEVQSTFLNKHAETFNTPVFKLSTSKTIDQNTVYLDVENYSSLSLYLAKVTAEIRLDKRLGILLQTIASSGDTPYSIRASLMYEIPTIQ